MGGSVVRVCVARVARLPTQPQAAVVFGLRVRLCCDTSKTFCCGETASLVHLPPKKQQLPENQQ